MANGVVGRWTRLEGFNGGSAALKNYTFTWIQCFIRNAEIETFRNSVTQDYSQSGQQSTHSMGLSDSRTWPKHRCANHKALCHMLALSVSCLSITMGTTVRTPSLFLVLVCYIHTYTYVCVCIYMQQITETKDISLVWTVIWKTSFLFVKSRIFFLTQKTDRNRAAGESPR